RELIEKVRQLGRRRRRVPGEARPRAPSTVPDAAVRARAPLAEGRLATSHHAGEVTLRAFSPIVPRTLLIGSSTGGPQALTTLLERLTPIAPRVPILITQHMPPTFTTILAEHLARASGRPAHEPADGEPIV